MRLPVSDFVPRLARLLGLAGLLGTVVLTVLDRGATRMYAVPWHFLLLLAQVAPISAVALRAVSPLAPLRLPPPRWLALTGATALVVLVSAVASPYRESSLLNALTPLAGCAAFLLIYDWLAADPTVAPARLLRIAGWIAAGLMGLSLAEWLGVELLPSLPLRSASVLFDLRNAHPLGHSNYTAGLALLALPWLGVQVIRTRGWVRTGWSFAVLLALVVLASSGSRGGIVGLAALAFAALLQSRIDWKHLLAYGLIACLVTATLALVHPRTRAMLQGLAHRGPATTLAQSDLQRRAMLQAGVLMGQDRPALGWGPGATPLAYPRFRAQLDGGVEDVLQLHDTPLQIWAELGGLGVLAAMAFSWLGAKKIFAPATRTRDPLLRDASLAEAAAAVTVLGYGVFSLTDFQLDLPIFALALAVCAALLALDFRSRYSPVRNRFTSPAVAATALLALAAVALLGRPDPAPALNVRALELARDPARADTAVALFNRSLADNPDQEIAHFNLGWLLVVRDPAAAERHFLAAAHLVPDKGGVYFGLALARLNQGHSASASQALALECLNDPLFLTSPWWRQPAIAALRGSTITELRSGAARAEDALAARHDRRAREARYVGVLAVWLDGQASSGEILGAAHTPERVGFFARRPDVPDFATAPIQRYRRERTGYPVLMRQLDLPPPQDVFDVQDNALATGEFKFLFPPKGWLPAPLLIELLDSPPPAASSSPVKR